MLRSSIHSLFTVRGMSVGHESLPITGRKGIWVDYDIGVRTESLGVRLLFLPVTGNKSGCPGFI